MKWRLAWIGFVSIVVARWWENRGSDLLADLKKSESSVENSETLRFFEMLLRSESSADDTLTERLKNQTLAKRSSEASRDTL